ncbi:MAG: ubiquinol-cytochrome c reductase iron-sulfur subunit [candidate division KSB1 bacterium]|nr:ubiquinol-cytochrome c reductase iron-sulfur subunit [candidate division KSB1 bacterium]MDZ7367339.1 ubiquinol-cytochrome c reductase iron-sulfur subunit [candidate division KSB1 bacterium]MDZ7405220.1 ubiquinol-cytochrome c reductase iron-sulfur subunit [candidate division KSB1 bacterium]
MENIQKQSRREFCLHACQAASLAVFGSSLATLLAGCGSENPVDSSGGNLPRIQATVANNTITLTIDANSPLAAVGSAALVQASGNSLLVARTAQDSFTAVTAICTHQACVITGYNNQIYTCPCHGSQFNTSGRVVRGPATSALRTFQTQFTNNQLSITLS